MKVYALVGRSGSGKSFRAQFLADKYHIPLIIDDGLLIKGDNIIAGKSAKQDPNFLTAVKTALFQDEDHYNQVMESLRKERFRKILILGTSDKMTSRIAKRLNLPEPSLVIHIEDIATQDEIETAMRVRYTEGKHVIPVPPIQITRTYPSIAYDSIKDIFRKRFNIFRRKRISNEKTVVKPEFSKHGDENQINLPALKQMVSQSLSIYSNSIDVEKVDYEYTKDGYTLEITLRTNINMEYERNVELQEYITDSLEKYGGIMINHVFLKVEQISSPY